MGLPNSGAAFQGCPPPRNQKKPLAVKKRAFSAVDSKLLVFSKLQNVINTDTNTNFYYFLTKIHYIF